MKIRGLTLEELNYFTNFLKQLSVSMMKGSTAPNIQADTSAKKVKISATLRIPPTVKKINKIINLFDISRSYLLLKKEDRDTANALIGTSLKALKSQDSNEEHVKKVVEILQSIQNKINKTEVVK